MIRALGYTIPFAFASGLNVYATVAVIGLCSHYGLVTLPEQFRALDNPIVIGIALVMYAVEFVADKIPWIDSIWDAIHTVIRPLGGAFVAVAALGDASPATTAIAALLGGSVAFATHVTKAGTRAVANTSPEPLSNWILSIVEDLIAVGLTYVAVRHPATAATIAILLLIVIAAFATVIAKAARRYLFTARSGT